METRANYALIGLFTLAVLAAAFGFVFWFSGKDAGASLKSYRIIFNGSVSGLQRGGQVLYNGLQVGSVTNLQLLQDDPSKVVALVEIDATTPMNVDTRARLEFTGLTGVASIQLTGGSPGSPPLVSKDPKQPPVILADRSDFQDLLESAQRLAKRADDVLTRADQLFSDNAGAISNTVRNIETFSEALAANSSGVAQFMTSTGNAADKIAALSVDLQKLSDSLDKVVRAVDPADVNRIVSDVSKVTTAIASESDKIADVVRNARELTARLNDTSVKIDEAVSDAGAVFKSIDPDKVSRVVDGLDKVATTLGDNSQQMAETLRNANELTAKLNKAGDRIDGVLADAGSALKSFDAALKGVDGAKVARTIDNIDRFSTALGGNSAKVDEIVRNAQELSAKLNRSADKVDEVLTAAQNFLGSSDANGALNGVTDMVRSIRTLADNLDKRTAEITAGVSRVTGPGLRDFEAFAEDGRRTLGELSRTLRSLERNPQQLLFGSKPTIPEYKGR